MKFVFINILIPVITGFVGGALGVIIAFRVLPIYEEAPITASIRRAEENKARNFPIEEIKQKLIWFFRSPPRGGVPPLGGEDLFGMGIALTADGLIAAPKNWRDVSDISAISYERRPFAVALGRDKKGARFYETESGFVFVKAVAKQGAEQPRLRPVVLAEYGQAAIGDLLIAVNQDGNFSFHRVIGLADLNGFFQIDGDPDDGLLLFNNKGEMIGVTKQNGLVFPAELIANILKQYLQNGLYQKMDLGIGLTDLSRVAQVDPKTPTDGLLLSGKSAVKQGSPADKAGLKTGDIIVSFDGRRLDGSLPFQILLQRYATGAEVEVVILRGSEEVKKKIIL